MKLCCEHWRCNKKQNQKSTLKNYILEEGTHCKQDYNTILVTEYKYKYKYNPKVIWVLIKPVLEDGTCHRKRNISVMDQRKPGETPLCKCGSLRLLLLKSPRWFSYAGRPQPFVHGNHPFQLRGLLLVSYFIYSLFSF